VARVSAESTETAFLDAAEQLFAEHGYDGTSIRDIAEAAGANLGALHYYWGSKRALFKVLCERRLRPVAEERLRRFDACVAAAGPGPLQLSAVLEASVTTAMVHPDETPTQSRLMRKLLARIWADPSPEVKLSLAEIFDESSQRYLRLLRQCCPHLDDQTFFWRMNCVMGATQHVNSGAERLTRLSHGKFNGEDFETGVRELVHALVAVLMAPSLAPAEPAAPGAARAPRRARAPADANGAPKARRAPSAGSSPGPQGGALRGAGAGN
jgi:AcrR family transcriptional regulator